MLALGTLAPTPRGLRVTRWFNVALLVTGLGYVGDCCSAAPSLQQYPLDMYAAPGISSDAQYVDMNGDGTLDLVGSLLGEPGITIGLNLSGIEDLGFYAAVVYDDSEGFIYSPALSTADLDGDGDEDVLASWSYPGQLGWHANIDGLGTLGPLQDIDLAANEIAQTFPADLDSDGDQDVVAILDGGTNLVWYENSNGLGSFGAPFTIATATNTFDQILADDLDGDGDADVVLADSAADEISWLVNLDGLGNFGARIIISDQATGVEELVTADIDGDSDLDILATLRGKDRVSSFRNVDGLGNFGAQLTISSDLQDPYHLEPGDLDGDGDLDLVVSSYSDGNAVWYEDLDGQGGFGAMQPFTLPVIGLASEVAVADFDFDGDLDVSVADPVHSRINWFENTDGLATFASFEHVAPLAYSPYRLAMDDIDGDGDTDVIFATTTDLVDALVWLQNPGVTGRFWKRKPQGAPGANWVELRLADLDGDGDPDCALGSSSTVEWQENVDGAGTFGARNFIASASSVEYVEPADLDSDGDLDLLISAWGDDEVSWIENIDGRGSFGNQTSLTNTAQRVFEADAMDLDGDGDLDVAYVSSLDNTLAWFENQDGSGSFGPENIISSTLDDPIDLVAGDIDSDGDTDLAALSRACDLVFWFENQNGLGSFGSSQTIATPFVQSSIDARSLHIVDTETDADPDLIVIAAGTLSYWLQNRNGLGFYSGQFLGLDFGYGPRAVTGDVNGDGREQLVVGSYTDNFIAVYSSRECSGDPNAGFDVDFQSGPAPLSVVFANSSTGTGALSWLWDFGDGATSTQQNPAHVYLSDGTYDVSLTATGAMGTCTSAEVGLIHVGSCGLDPSVDFSATPLSGTPFLDVQFLDSSTGSGIDTWSWDFGDGSFSSLQSPNHVYSSPGTYSVTLTAQGDLGSCSKIKTNLIQVFPCGSDPIADFSATPTTGPLPLSVQFTDTSIGTGIDQWLWDFGDGAFSSLQSPEHTYYNAGSYDVTLWIQGDLGYCTISKANLIVASTDGSASAILRNGSGVNPLVFTSLSDPVLGLTWSSEIDAASIGATGLTTLFGFDRPLNGTFLAFGEVLVDLTSPLYILNASFVISGKARFDVPVPNDASMIGLSIYTQALFVTPYSLTNAIDLVLGN